MKKCIACLTLLFLAFGSAWAKTSLRVVCLGDSLTEGYGISKEKAFPHLLEEALKAKGIDATVVNGGVSGSTTASGKSRLEWLLKKKPADILILALGANDGLRGLKLDQSKKNLEEIIEFAKTKDMKVLLAGMRLPPNYGPKYTEKFHQMFTDLQKRHKLEMVPFLLKEVGGKKELNLEDGIHPNEEGHKLITETIMKNLESLL